MHSVAGLLPPGGALLRQRPFRAPHHTCSEAALVGGGSLPRPGEITLAHHGVLFLDELPEFSRRTLEVLRQPLEEGRVRIARAAGSVTFPARFSLVAAMNPCPCGYLGHPTRPCRCTPMQVQQYARGSRARCATASTWPSRWRRCRSTTLTAGAGEASAAVRARVDAARARQLARGPVLNARLAGPALSRDARARRRRHAGACARRPRGSVSAPRAVHRLLRVARTIADLDGAARIRADHVAEAAQYRHGDAVPTRVTIFALCSAAAYFVRLTSEVGVICS